MKLSDLPKVAKTILVNAIVLFVFLEIVSVIAIYVFDYTSPPKFNTIKYNRYHFVDIDKDFGAWHYPNYEARRTTECYDVYYKFNSFGARDIERTIEAGNVRILLLGDSFIEGYGVNAEERISNILENKLQKEVMNFGTSGNFGSTQMSILYEKLASKFQHSIVLIGILPANDFDDNSLEKGKIQHYFRYRPYRVLDSNNSYQLTYYLDSLEKSDWYPGNLQTNKFNYETFVSYAKLTHTGRVLFQLKKNIKGKIKKDVVISKFRDYTDEEIDLMKYDLTKIGKDAIGKKVIVFAIPSQSDFIMYYQDTINYNKLGYELDTFCKNQNMKYWDVFSEMLRQTDQNNFRDLYLTCDPHFSVEGQKLCAEVLYQYFKNDSF